MARHLRGASVVGPDDGTVAAEEVRTMSLTGRRAAEFARLLDNRTPTNDPVSAPMLAISAALGALPPVPAPRPEFKAALRQRVMAVAAVHGVGSTVDSPATRVKDAVGSWRVQRRMLAVAATTAVVTGVSGVGVSASRSLPGDPFYSVKRVTEDVQLATAQGPEARGKRHLEFARTRLDEVQALVAETSSLGPAGPRGVLAAGAGTGDAGLIASTLRDMDDETRAGANDLFAAFQDSGSTAPLRTLDRFTQQQYRELRTLLGSLPESTQLRAQRSLALLTVVATDTVRLAAPSRPLPGTSGSTVGPGPANGPSTSPQPRVDPGTSSSPAPDHSSSPGTSGRSTSSPTPSSSGSSPTLNAPSVQPLPTVPPLPAGGLPTAVPTIPDLSSLLGP